MKKRILAGLLAGMMCFSLTACSSSKGAAKPESAVNETASEAEQSVETEEEKGTETKEAAEKPVSGKITFVHCEGNDKPGFIKLVDEFKAAYPDVELEASYMVNSELKKNMQINMLAGNLPDVLVFDSPDFATFAANGYFLDITEYMNEWGEIGNFYEGPLNSVTYDGKIYGLPWYSNNLAIYYNKEMLEKAGVEPPTTWEEVEAAAAKLTKGGVYGFGMALPKSEVATFQYIPWLYSAGGDMSDLSSAAATEALTFVSGLVEKGYMSKEVVNWAHGDLEKAFLGKKVAMIEFGSWGLSSLKSAEFEWGVVPMPAKDANGKSITVIGGYDVGISKDCKNLDAALAFLKFIGSKEQGAAYAEAVGCIPVRGDVEEKTFWEEEPMKIFADSMPNAVSRVNPFWPDLSANVQTAIQKAVTGEKTPTEALNEAHEKNAAYWNIK